MALDASKNRDVAVPFVPVSAAPFVEAADPGHGWRVLNVPPGQAEVDTEARVLRVSLDVTEAAAAARAQELARIAWGRSQEEPIPTGLWAGFVFGAEEARLTRCLADVDVSFPSGRCEGTGYVESVVAQTELGSMTAAVAGAVSVVGSGEDEQELIRVLGRLVRDPTRKVARCAEVALKAMAVARAAFDRYDDEQRRSPAVTIGVASEIHRTVEAAAEEDREREKAERNKDRERVEKAKQKAREEADGAEDGDDGEGDDGEDAEGDPSERDGKADDDTEGAEGDEPDHEPEEEEGEGEESGDGPPEGDASPSESPEDGEETDDGGEDGEGGDTSEGMAEDDDASPTPAKAGKDAAPAPAKPREETPEERTAREAREAEHQRKIREAEAAAARSEQTRIDVERANEEARQRRLESEKARKATDVIQRVRAATTAKEEKAAAIAERDEAEGITESRNEAKASRDEFHAAFGDAAAEAAKMIEVGADSMAKTYRDRLGYRMMETAKWAPCATINVPMPVKVRRIESPRKRWSDTGAYLRAPHRLYTDGYAFQHNTGGRDGGSVLIDVSGSMALTVEDVARLVRAAPAVNVAVYAGDNNLRDGYLRVVASRGRMVEDQHLTFPFHANLCDGPALREWLAKQPMPRIWISDGMVTGQGEAIVNSLLADCVRICRAKSIVRVGNVDEAMRLFRKINPRAAALADRYEKEKADGLRA